MRGHPKILNRREKMKEKITKDSRIKNKNQENEDQI